MTRTRGGGKRTEPAAGDELAVVERTLRGQGFRWTSQRRLIARVALANHQHFSAEQLLELCRREDSSVSRATVYRTLAVLCATGFVEGHDLGDGGKRFEHVLGHHHHDHMVCTACGRLIEFVDEELERRQQAAARRRGFKITSHSLKLFGVCIQYERTGRPCTDAGDILDK